MATFFMFGTYSADALRKISPARTDQARQAIEELGGEVKGIYALLGEYDLVFIVDLPNTTDAMKASVALGQLTGVTFKTSAAMPVEEFDNIVGQHKHSSGK